MQPQQRCAGKGETLREEIILERFPDPAAQACLRGVSDWILKVAKGGDPTKGSKRKAAFVAATKTARKLSKALEKLDLRTLVIAMGTIEGPHWLGSDGARASSLVPQRLDELREFRERLALVSRALEKIAAEEPPVRRGAPTVDDRLLFGVECLGAIWRKFLPSVPLTGGRNRDGFDEFAEVFFGTRPFEFSAAEIHTAVRYYVASRLAEAREPSDGTSAPTDP